MLVVRWIRDAGRTTAGLDFGVAVKQAEERIVDDFREIMAIDPSFRISICRGFSER